MKTSTAAAVVSTAGVVLLLSGCGIAMGSEHSESQSFDAPDGAVTIDTNHDVVVEIGPSDAIELELRGTEAPKASWSPDDGVLTLRADEQWFDFGPTKSTVQVPAGHAVTIHSTNGDIELEGLSDGIEVTSQNGDVSLDEVSGTVDVESPNGDVELASAAALDEVRLETSNGDISASLGADASYRVEADSDNGDVSVDVERDPDSDRVLTAISNNGDVTIGR